MMWQSSTCDCFHNFARVCQTIHRSMVGIGNKVAITTSCTMHECFSLALDSFQDSKQVVLPVACRLHIISNASQFTVIQTKQRSLDVGHDNQLWLMSVFGTSQMDHNNWNADTADTDFRWFVSPATSTLFWFAESTLSLCMRWVWLYAHKW